MKILFASAEVDPFAKVGGLADVAAGLPRELFEAGHDVRVFTPCHASSAAAFDASRHRTVIPVLDHGETLDVELAAVEGPGGAPVTLVRCDRYFPRPSVYGERDDLDRYLFFCRTVATMLRTHRFVPDVLHLNDWHTAPLAFALRNLAWDDPGLRQVISVLTIHNLRYRGPDELNDCLGQGINYSDAITTVSPGYAREILEPGAGEGLDDLLHIRADRLSGILNGIDTERFDPLSDAALDKNFGPHTLDARDAARAKFREFAGFTGERPVAAMISRLTEQKGVDLLIAAIPSLVALDVDIFVLGNGDSALEKALGGLEGAFPGRVRHVIRYDDALGRRAYSGADLFLMPSRFEPCGLGQMIAMRYGCVPIGRRTGGLADTIVDPHDNHEGATGYLFNDYDPAALVEGVRRALDGYSDHGWWRHLQRNGMTHDFSWTEPSRRYLDAYRGAFSRRGLPVPEGAA